MVMPMVVDQPSEMKTDEDRPSNILEYFVELNDVQEMIRSLKSIEDKHFEKDYENFSKIVGRYQEQPHLLDSHLEVLINSLLNIIKKEANLSGKTHGAYKYLYQLCKVRQFKTFVRFMPHELPDFEFALAQLEKACLEGIKNWETRYILLLWMSLLVLNPFDMARLDTFQQDSGEPAGDNMNGSVNVSKMERVYNLCKANCSQGDTCSTVAAYLTGKYLIREDVKRIYLSRFFDWVMNSSKDSDENGDRVVKWSHLAAISNILKYGKCDDLYGYMSKLLGWILEELKIESNTTDFLRNKFLVKILQRIGMVMLFKRRLQVWRYQRGSRSLATNLEAGAQHTIEFQSTELEAGDEDHDVPEEIDDVVDQLLQALQSPSSDVRWSAGKGLGRIAARLPKQLGDEVVGSTIEQLQPNAPHEAWHGSCLALAEMAKNGLLMPQRLPNLVPLLLNALTYDEMKGFMSVGQHIRDAACYICWAFARAYDPADLQPFVEQISAGLLITTVFDREVNCRRAASAAFQESVGRLGNFPHGIDILTAADFYMVGQRKNSYLIISDYVAQFTEYTVPMIDHLVQRKTNHWDRNIRELTSKALYTLTKWNPLYMSKTVLVDLFNKTASLDVNQRDGAVLAIGEIILALSELNNRDSILTMDIIQNVNMIVLNFECREQFRGMSGEMLKHSCCKFIENCSNAKVSVSDDCIGSWQTLITKCIQHKSPEVRDAATTALSALAMVYYDSQSHYDTNIALLEEYMQGCSNDLEEFMRMGYVTAVGALPKFIVTEKLDKVLEVLIKSALPPEGQLHALLEMNPTAANIALQQSNQENIITVKWSEARRDAIRALTKVVETVGFDGEDSIRANNRIDKVFNCLLKALGEYTLDNRGDIGAWVREAAMESLFGILTTCPHEVITPAVMHSVMAEFAQQAVEKIDRTRAKAGRYFCRLVNHEPRLPHINHQDKLKEIFPADPNEVSWLFADHTFPLFCALLEYHEYSDHVILGLSASIGQLTESLIKHASSSFCDYLRSHPDQINRICNEIVNVFQKNSMNERITYPMLNFLDIMLSSGALNDVLLDAESNFADDIYRLVNLEIQGHKRLYKMASSINVYCQLIQVPKICTKALSKMSVFLGLTHVHIRKTTATKLYEALILHGSETSIPEENLEKIQELLCEFDWGTNINEVRDTRNEICVLMGINPPVKAAPRK